MPTLVIGAPEREYDFAEVVPHEPNSRRVVEFGLLPVATGSVAVKTVTTHEGLGILHHLTLLKGTTELQTQREQNDCQVEHSLVAGQSYRVTVEGATANTRGKFKIRATAVAAAMAGVPAAPGLALTSPDGAKKAARKPAAKKSKRSTRAKTAPPKRAPGRKSTGTRKATRRRRSDR